MCDLRRQLEGPCWKTEARVRKCSGNRVAPSPDVWSVLFDYRTGDVCVSWNEAQNVEPCTWLREVEDGGRVLTQLQLYVQRQHDDVDGDVAGWAFG